MEEGPKYGYYPEPRKSFLLVGRDSLTEAHSLFDGHGVNIVTNHRFTGGVVGNEEEMLTL